MSCQHAPRERRRIGLIQGVIPHYRVAFFQSLARVCDLTVFFGAGDRHGFYSNARMITGFHAEQMPTWRLNLRALHPYLHAVRFSGLGTRLSALSPELVVAPGILGFPNTLAALRFCRKASVPLVVWDSGRQVAKKTSWFRRILTPIERHILRNAAACIGYSSVASCYFEQLGVEPSRVFVAPNAIDVRRNLEDHETLSATPGVRQDTRRRLGVHPDASVLLYVGAIEQRKRLDRLFEVGDALRREGSNVEVLVVGDGPWLHKAQALARDRSVPVHFTGRIVDGIGAYFVSSDIFVLPGPGGLAINHAMSYGLPVVACDGDGTEGDLLADGACGFVVEDSSEMLESVRALLGDERLRGSLGKNALRRIQGVGVSQMVDRFLGCFESVLARDQVGNEPLPAVARSGQRTQVR